MLTFQTLETPRLSLRLLPADVLNQIFETCTEEEACFYLGLKDHDAYLAEYHKYEKGLESFKVSLLRMLLIIQETGEIIGACGFHNWFKEHRRAEIGYHIDNENHRNHGYMSEAVAAVLKYGFSHLELERIEALIDNANTPSKKILQKMGFVKEATIRRHYRVNGVNEDSNLYSLMPEEFAAISGQP